MNYLTQYYKNRCNQLQEQISQINYSLHNIAEASSAMATNRPSVSDSGGGGYGGNYDDTGTSSQNTGGFDGAYFGQLLGSNPAAAYAYAASFQNGGAQTSGGNGVGAAAQRIMAGQSPTANTRGAFGVADSGSAGYGGGAYSGAVLGQILGNLGGAAAQQYLSQFGGGQYGPQVGGPGMVQGRKKRY